LVAPWGRVSTPRWPTVLLAACVALLGFGTLVWLSGEDMLLGWMLLLVVVGWGLLAGFGIVSSVKAVRRGTDRLARQRLVLGWIGCSLALFGSLGLGVAGVSADVRFRLSRHALVDAGERVLAGEHPTRAGLFALGRTSVMGECAMLRTGTFAVGEFGWAYCPTGRPVPPGWEHVEGKLYKYEFD
jgi:hypothetical protein